MCAVGFSLGTPLANAHGDGVPAQVVPWGEILRNAPRTDPKPWNNAVPVG